MKVYLGEISLLLTGDIESSSEHHLVEGDFDLQSTILKVPHHGSRTSSTLPFLQVVSPEISIIMCAAGNRYGHPHAETLVNLKQVGAKVYRTDMNGHIVVYTDGVEYTVWVGRE